MDTIEGRLRFGSKAGLGHECFFLDGVAGDSVEGLGVEAGVSFPAFLNSWSFFSDE